MSAYKTALTALATWPLPRWEPDNPQTEGEQMRLYAIRVLAGNPCPCGCHQTWPDVACRDCIGNEEHA